MTTEGAKRTCNLHVDCDGVDQTIMELMNGRKAYHCHQVDCPHCESIKNTIKKKKEF